MTIFGKRPSEYVAFCRPWLILIFVVALTRLGLSLANVPISITRFVAVTVVIWIGIIYYGIRVHTTGFGSFRHLWPISFLMLVTLQIVIVPSIILSIYTGHHNAFSAPEVNFGSDGRNWTHALMHIFFAPTVGATLNWLLGCLAMLITKAIVPKKSA
jgi:hypothetical protein